MTSLPFARQAILQRICNTELLRCSLLNYTYCANRTGERMTTSMLGSCTPYLDGVCMSGYVTDGNKLIALHFVDELRIGTKYKQTGCILRFRRDFNL
jgi:hypothetical protein